jgi:lipopolysaccharide transport system ATP-binding protein
MSKAEIDRKFDEIVEFAEIEKFIDTPVKRYSSGMYVRLAFAVAAHLEPEILLVDEVLAVGDAAFQKKCLGKMGDVAKAGRTVLFVSHNMAAVEGLCGRALLLVQGSLIRDAGASETIRAYLEDLDSVAQSFCDATTLPRPMYWLGRQVEIIGLRVLTPIVRIEEPLRFRYTIKANETVSQFGIGLTIFNADGTPVGNSISGPCLSMKKGETATFDVELHDHRLAKGRYYCYTSTCFGTPETGTSPFDVVGNVLHFEVNHPGITPGTQATWYRGWGSIRFTPLIVRPLKLIGNGEN